MELIATSPNAPLSVFAYGAYVHGVVLRCPVLFVRCGTSEVITLYDPTTKEKMRVRLPYEATRTTKPTRFAFAELEIVENKG